MVRVNVEDIQRDLLTTPRPFGLCAGEFTVPDDFDAPLPEDLLDVFMGSLDSMVPSTPKLDL
jgi:hypothetical protein